MRGAATLVAILRCGGAAVRSVLKAIGMFICKLGCLCVGVLEFGYVKVVKSVVCSILFTQNCKV